MSDTDWTDYESGPFCRHWSSPSDCDELCGECQHRCTAHEMTEGESGCNETDCNCEEWSDER